MASDGDDDFDVELFLRLCRVPAKAVPAAAAGLRDDGFDSADVRGAHVPYRVCSRLRRFPCCGACFSGVRT